MVQLSMVKGDHRWIFRWYPGDETLVLEAMADLASDLSSGFDWYDAAVMSGRIRLVSEG